MPPSIGENELGFAESIENFDAVIDTLGDEAIFQRVQDFDGAIDRVFGYVGVSKQLCKTVKCQRYVSTLTQSQELVLKEGILFARDPVLQYQKSIEAAVKKVQRNGGSKNIDNDGGDNGEYIALPAPSDYGRMLEILFSKNVVFPTDRNENGSHQNKEVFVRGCSFPDYAEIEIWPADSTDGATVRFGFPGIAEMTLEARVEKMMGSNNREDKEMTTTWKRRQKYKQKPLRKTATKKKQQSNPFVSDVESLGDLREEVVDPQKDAVLFVSAPYCKLCR